MYASGKEIIAAYDMYEDFLLIKESRFQTIPFIYFDSYHYCNKLFVQFNFDVCEHPEYETIHAIDHKHDLCVCLDCEETFIHE